jgi:hypothetical protein
VKNSDTGMVMPKTTNHFKVVFEGFGTGDRSEQLARQVVKCSCPSIDLSFDLRQFGLFLSNTKWNDIKLVLRDDVTNVVIDEVMTQVRDQLMDELRRFKLKILALDGSDTVLHETVLLDCKIIKYTSNDWDYSSTKPKTITLHVTFTLE